MIIDANRDKVGFGSWYYTRSYNEAAKARFATLREFDLHNKMEAFKRVAGKVKENCVMGGTMARFKVVGGAKPIWYKGIVLRGGFDKYNGGYIVIKQPKTERVLQCHTIDEVEILG